MAESTSATDVVSSIIEDMDKTRSRSDSKLEKASGSKSASGKRDGGKKQKDKDRQTPLLASGTAKMGTTTRSQDRAVSDTGATKPKEVIFSHKELENSGPASDEVGYSGGSHKDGAENTCQTRELQAQIDTLTKAVSTILPVVQRISANMGAHDSSDENDNIHVDDEDDLDESRDHTTAGNEATAGNDDLLALLSQSLKMKEACGPAVDAELAEKIDTMMSTGISDQRLTEVKEKYLRPDNCQYLVVPQCQREVWTGAGEILRSRDLKLQRVQGPLVKGMTCLTEVMNSLMGAVRDKNDMPSGRELLEKLSDCLCLLAGSNAEINLRRKDVWKTEMPDNTKDLCAASRPLTDFLFGSDLSTAVKELTETHKMTTQFKRFTPSFKRFSPYNKPHANRQGKLTSQVSKNLSTDATSQITQ
ncbi:uncharacterized protein LOC106153058 [Lingula anatina]|uniref:Uncharacterized protein LOC106153058 n=1 Tax=Lingula anatina TaxID=7574 RepID=A0A2R2ML76_LINAN|nr:uncharacterized protein LOC106153058 [Lingula anatina]|eukprot:XP_023930955.1 uncharacterized protein LOC106153058 [Lingula anatina]